MASVRVARLRSAYGALVHSRTDADPAGHMVSLYLRKMTRSWEDRSMMTAPPAMAVRETSPSPPDLLPNEAGVPLARIAVEQAASGAPAR